MTCGQTDADLDGEDCPELIPISEDEPWQQRFRNDCTGVWDSEDYELFLPYCLANDIAAADLDEDGDLDVVLSSADADSVMVDLNTRLPSAVDEGGTPAGARVRLSGNHPNPFNPATEICFTLAAEGRARLSVHDGAGRQVALLADRFFEAGSHAVAWRPVGLGSGVYLLRLEAGGEVATGKAVLIK